MTKRPQVPPPVAGDDGEAMAGTDDGDILQTIFCLPQNPQISQIFQRESIMAQALPCVP